MRSTGLPLRALDQPTGTVEQVHTQLTRLNPGFDTHFLILALNPPSLNKRFGPICGGGPNGATTAPPRARAYRF